MTLSRQPCTAPTGVNPLGPMFVSYRASDGSEWASKMAWALRATGVPVWHDTSDLPPGDTSRRLEGALAAGLSGAVLIVTPEIEASTVVRNVELPRLLELERCSTFSLAIASAVMNPLCPEELDFEAPDRLLCQSAGTLRRVKQYPLRAIGDITALAHQMALQRMSVHASLSTDPLVIDLQTRAAPRAAVSNAGLVVRLKPPEAGHRRPPIEIWTPYRAFLTDLPNLVTESGASSVVIRGGAHLSVAFALGAALPVTLGWPVTVTTHADHWRDNTESPAVSLVEDTRSLDPRGRIAAIAIDLVPAPAPIDTFSAHLASAPERYIAGVRISLGQDGMIPANTCGAIVADLTHRIRGIAARFQTRHVALFLRVPFPIAVHLGRTLNTLEVDVFEWEDGAEPPVYVPTITVASGRGASPIVNVSTSSTI